MIVSLIVAAAKNGVIGKDGKIPWHLSSEQAIFKQTTMGHPIIMGRKTHESISRALPGRTNIVITRQKHYQANGCIVVGSLKQAIKEAEIADGADEIFIIGGAEIYQQALPQADRLYLTRVHTNIDGDKFFNFDESQWQQLTLEEHSADANNPYDYDFILLERK